MISGNVCAIAFFAAKVRSGQNLELEPRIKEVVRVEVFLYSSPSSSPRISRISDMGIRSRTISSRS
jgi:hypothetical protein